jgi:hypothetical protein
MTQEEYHEHLLAFGQRRKAKISGYIDTVSPVAGYIDTVAEEAGDISTSSKQMPPHRQHKPE